MKNYIYKYLVIYISIFWLYFLSASYSSFNNIERDLGYHHEIILYWLFSIFQSIVVLLLYVIFFNSITKIELKNINLYFLTLF